jgi:2-(1,2-epoxy-1,2-dihydrophenyl)acetyl-CoA isomerase
MPLDDDVTVTIGGGVAEIALNRPAKRNSLGLGHIGLLRRRLDEATRAGARCILLRGEGPAFCSGRDLAGIDFDTEDSHKILSGLINPLLAEIRECPIPTLAAVQGACLGLGLGIAMACDLVYAADNAQLGSPFRAIGCVLDSGAHHALKERIGRHRAAELIFTGRLLSGREAAAIGLVNAAIAANDLRERTGEIARSIASGPSMAFRESKAILLAAEEFSAMAEKEALAQGRIMKTHDAREGISAFLQKRRPDFRGT